MCWCIEVSTSNQTMSRAAATGVLMNVLLRADFVGEIKLCVRVHVFPTYANVCSVFCRG